ncbi:MAG TPA: hypothetical protein VN455_09070 [Methanotrichaceae archaeon]|nr:hypothetical protein [Methanotrichaceae archaeon]
MTCQDDLMEFRREIEKIKNEQKRRKITKSYIDDIEDHRRASNSIRAKS